MLIIENKTGGRGHAEYYLSKIEIKDHNGEINGQNLFDQQVNKNIKTYRNIRKVASGQRIEYITECLLDYPYLKENYNLIAIDLRKNRH